LLFLEGVDCFPAQRRAVLEGNAEYRQVVKSGLSVSMKQKAITRSDITKHETRTGDCRIVNCKCA